MLGSAISGVVRLCHVSPANVHVFTEDGYTFIADSSVLASSSPVLENMISNNKLKILGVPHTAVLEFLLFLADRDRPPHEQTSAMNFHAVHLLALSHSYNINWLKLRCETAIANRVGPNDALDMMKLAELCDAPRLRLHCLTFAAQNFAAVQRTESWRFVQKHDPRMELEILRFMGELKQRRKRWRREREDCEAFLQLSEAMECLEHICTEGCTVVGPHDGEKPSRSRGPCTSFRTCEMLQFLIRHFGKCGKKGGGGGCVKCKRMWQLFRLHSWVCARKSCKVPLCRQFKVRLVDGNEKGDDATWRLLVRKVILAGVMSSLAARRMPEELIKAWEIIRKMN